MGWQTLLEQVAPSVSLASIVGLYKMANWKTLELLALKSDDGVQIPAELLTVSFKERKHLQTWRP